MIRSLLVLNAVLVLALGLLWRVDAKLELRREARRMASSAFHRIAGARTPLLADVRRVDLGLPDAERKWTYVREEVGWRMPGHRHAFALAPELEGILKSFVREPGAREGEERCATGTIVGQVPGDEAHFGIFPGKTLDVEMRDASGNILIHAIAGAVAPGQRSGECYATASGETAILHMDSNPWSYLKTIPGSKLPPLLDQRVIPGALGRGLPVKITFEGKDILVSEIVRREIPKERLLALGPDRGPRFEWFGTTAEGEKRLNDSAAFAYTSFLASLTFEDLVGPLAGHEARFSEPELSITVEYDGAVKDRLVAGPAGERGAFPLLHSTTGQVFLIAGEKRASMVPDWAALLTPPAEPPGGAR